MANSSGELSKDTRPLVPSELSDNELLIIHKIEDRLRQAQRSERKSGEPIGRDRYLFVPEVRHPRVILLDGGRGTGKTSLMLTLAKRWHGLEIDKNLEDSYADRLQYLPEKFAKEKKELERDSPKHVSVLDILDFDPLPPGMPLVAAIIEAWRPMVSLYDGPSEDETGDLLDAWHRLFRIAASGWTGLLANRGLLEQVLDREEQVENWHNLDKDWNRFISSVFKRNKSRQNGDTVHRDSVFVIMIDDCDLQVGRVRELLPALRLLYDERVFFIVAADSAHMMDMLKLDFLGQQVKLARYQGQTNPLKEADNDKWADLLAKASFEKVFPIRNRFLLQNLSLSAVLQFESPEGPLNEILNEMLPLATSPYQFGPMGGYLHKMTQNIEPDAVPSVWTYRGIHQIAEDIVGQPADRRAAVVIGRLIAGSDYDTLIKPVVVVERRGRENEPSDVSDEDAGATSDGQITEYLDSGTLEANFPEEFRELTRVGRIDLSSQPAFRFRDSEGALLPDNRSRRHKEVSSIIALSLQDDGYGVSAPRLRWEVQQALVWTRITLPSGELVFPWNLYRHPSPLKLLNWAKDWRRFVTKVRNLTDYRPQRIAYAWLFYQLQWMSDTELVRKLNNVTSPLDMRGSDLESDEGWKDLLSEKALSNKEDEISWELETIPLLARPEIGLPPEVQKRCLSHLDREDVQKIDKLKGQRRKLIADALQIAANKRNERSYDGNVNDASVIDKVIREAERLHRSTHNPRDNPEKKSPWDEIMNDSVDG